MTKIATGFENYFKACYPSETPVNQLKEIEQAWYAACRYFIVYSLSLPNNEDDAVACLDDAFQECLDYEKRRAQELLKEKEN